MKIGEGCLFFFWSLVYLSLLLFFFLCAGCVCERGWFFFLNEIIQDGFQIRSPNPNDLASSPPLPPSESI